MAQSNKGVPYTVEFCPTCDVDFMSVGYQKDGYVQKWKRCPNGHEHSVSDIWKHKKRRGKPSGPTLRSLGVAKNGQESAEIALIALVGAYDRLLPTLSGMGRALVEGVMENAVAMARRVIR